MQFFRSPKLNPQRRGQAIIEMALVVTILLFLSLGLVQYALLANARTSLTNLAREGARYAALHATEPASDTAIQKYVVQVAKNTPLDTLVEGNVSITPALNDATRVAGQPIKVTVRYDMRQKFILPSSFPGLSGIGAGTNATATMVIQG